jgi:hypothetical protein
MTLSTGIMLFVLIYIILIWKFPPWRKRHKRVYRGIGGRNGNPRFGLGANNRPNMNTNRTAIRVDAQRQLVKWGAAKNDYYLTEGGICDLLGYDSMEDMFDKFNENDCRKLELICGPHGYAIYKMLLARQS